MRDDSLLHDMYMYNIHAFNIVIKDLTFYILEESHS